MGNRVRVADSDPESLSPSYNFLNLGFGGACKEFLHPKHDPGCLAYQLPRSISPKSSPLVAKTVVRQHMVFLGLYPAHRDRASRSAALTKRNLALPYTR